jgi:hypothetical protein
MIAAAVSATAVIPAVVVAAAAPVEATSDSVCLSAQDWQLVDSEPLRLGGGVATQGIVGLWYSPSTRCVYGKMDRQTTTAYLAIGMLSRQNQVTGAVDQHPCTITSGNSTCTTDKYYDGNVFNGVTVNFQSMMSGELHIGTGTYTGKTSWY